MSTSDMSRQLEYGFPPLLGITPHTLILGSMPSVKSLAEQQYYAHPRNTFWPIMAKLFNFDSALPYSERCAALKRHPIAVWDVIRACHRDGSLDNNIEPDALVLNDFNALLDNCPSISRLFFNGIKAETLFKQRLPALAPRFQTLTMQRLPSTSPAHAAMSFEQKLLAWQSVL